MPKRSGTDALPGDPSAAQLARYFHLDDEDRSVVELRRGDANRLGFAVQLCTVRFLGTFLADPTVVPASVVTYVSRQLRIDPTCLPHYLDRAPTHRDHAREIQRRYGYQDFHAPPEYGRLGRWLYLRAWVSDERPSLLFDLATARLVERKILRPGVTVLGHPLDLDELGPEILYVGIVQLKLPFEGTIRHPPVALKQFSHLFQHLVERHAGAPPSAPGCRESLRHAGSCMWAHSGLNTPTTS